MDAPLAMVVLVTLRDGVSRGECEGWVAETYGPAVVALPSVGDWRGYRADRLLASEEVPPYDYVVTLDVADPGGWEPTRRASGCRRCWRAHELVEVVQMSSTRFA